MKSAVVHTGGAWGGHQLYSDFSKMMMATYSDKITDLFSKKSNKEDIWSIVLGHHLLSLFSFTFGT